MKPNRLPYSQLTLEQKTFLCNGCGGKGGKINPPEFRFNASCNHHDYNYTLGYRRRDRLRADWQFLWAMLKDAKWRLWLWLPAILYFVAVRCIGWKFFRYDDHELTEVEIVEMIDGVDSE